MIYAWEIDVGVILNLGSVKSMLAFIWENRRAVAIVKNKAHRDCIVENLSHDVKTQGLAPDARPAKPEQLTAWEAKMGERLSASTSKACCNKGRCDIPAAGSSRHALPTCNKVRPHTSWATRAATGRFSATTASHGGLVGFGATVLTWRHYAIDHSDWSAGQENDLQACWGVRTEIIGPRSAWQEIDV
jgi:hypothetical protein